MFFTPECERCLAATTQAERDRSGAVLDAPRGSSVWAARVALVAADLGASDEALDDLAVIISSSPVLEINAAGSGLFAIRNGREHAFPSPRGSGARRRFS
jgi:hypothetical protein